MQYILIAIVLMVLCLFSLSCRRGLFMPIGAMCYSIAVVPERTDYVCPTCGDKTLYAFDNTLEDPNAFQRSWDVATISNEIESCRRLVKQINNFDIELDESQFCKVCSPGIECPQLGLAVKHPDKSKLHRVWGVNEYDLTVIKAFTDGQLQTKEFSDTRVRRLEELLGVKLNNTNIKGGD